MCGSGDPHDSGPRSQRYLFLEAGTTTAVGTTYFL